MQKADEGGCSIDYIKPSNDLLVDCIIFFVGGGRGGSVADLILLSSANSLTYLTLILVSFIDLIILFNTFNRSNYDLSNLSLIERTDPLTDFIYIVSLLCLQSTQWLVITLVKKH